MVDHIAPSGCVLFSSVYERNYSELVYESFSTLFFVRYSKELIRPESERLRLKAVNRVECDRLIERWQSAECVNAIMKFFSK